MIWMLAAHAGPPEVLGTPPDRSTDDIVYVEAQASCPFSRTLVAALLAASPTEAVVVAVTPDAVAPWRDLVAERGWEDLVVQPDPEGTLAAELFRQDGRLGTVALWSDGGRRVSWTPSREGDPPWRETLAFISQPDRVLQMGERYSDIELVLYAEDGPRQARRIAKYLLRRETHPHAMLEAGRALGRLGDKPRDAERAAALLAKAGATFPDDEAVLAAVETPAPAVSELTGEQLVAAVRRMDGLVQTYYSGLVVVDERIGGWDAHVAGAVEHAMSRPTWPWADAARWLAYDVLGPVDDAHFHIWGSHPEDERQRIDRWASVDGIVWFTDLVLDGSGAVVSGPEPLLGTEIDLPVVPEPKDASFDGVYRFPSVQATGAPSWLVGTFARAELDVLSVAGHELPVHRTRSASPAVAGAWGVVDGAPLPTLAVRTMRTAELEGLADTAGPLRQHPQVVVDLRANSGGSDQPALDWFSAFGGGPFRLPNLASKRAAGWYAMPPSPLWQPDAEAYEGQLYVLTDKGTCSSGETFTMLASQVDGALRVGENTAGCLTQGNVLEVGVLPYLGLALSFGTSAFHGDPVPGREAWGYFPHLWLDVDDPVGLLAELPEGAAAAASDR